VVQQMAEPLTGVLGGFKKMTPGAPALETGFLFFKKKRGKEEYYFFFRLSKWRGNRAWVRPACSVVSDEVL
jgi:hypothetical protein